MNWELLTDEAQLDLIVEKSKKEPVVIFKHSIRCNISSMAKARLEREIAPAGVHFYLLDLLKYRSISSKIAEQFRVVHQSPQVLLIRNGDCIYDESHNGIEMDEIAEQASLVK
ncbi:MAG: bacillithiol system redox-active protein YtxJ [Bacteroidetes bacterium]|nr:bacillithiol system redox-active protein YtxJ [Bacteroidota bacterium]